MSSITSSTTETKFVRKRVKNNVVTRSGWYIAVEEESSKDKRQIIQYIEGPYRANQISELKSHFLSKYEVTSGGLFYFIVYVELGNRFSHDTIYKERKIRDDD